MSVIYECLGVELREAGGESFSTVISNGHLVVKSGLFGQPSIEIDRTSIDFVSSSNTPFKKIDYRQFMLATNDLMSFNYITLPAGLQEEMYARFEEILTCMKEGKAIPAAKPIAPGAAAAPASTAAKDASASAAPAAAATAAPAAGASQQGGGIGGMLKTIADKAAHDTQMLASAIQQKAAHDIAQMQAQNAAKQA